MPSALPHGVALPLRVAEPRIPSPHQRLDYRIVMVERALKGTRWLDPATPADVEAAEGWPDTRLPAGDIPEGKETAVLLRHGFRQWRDLYPRRQRAVLTALLDAIAELPVDETVRQLLHVPAVGTAEMAGLASRWDRFYLKAYEATANHRFAFVPFTAEPNIWGDETSGRGTFIRRIRQLRRSLAWFRLEKRLAEAQQGWRSLYRTVEVGARRSAPCAPQGRLVAAVRSRC